MEYSKLTIGDIMQSNILYYDKKISRACVDICQHLRVDNLPAINGQHFYKYQNRTFKKYKISRVHRLSTDEHIFNESILTKFSKNEHNVLFVYFGNTLCGVVHISDYNKNIVLQKIQDDLLLFERSLRQLILLHGFENVDMLRYFEYRLSKEKREKNKQFYRDKIAHYKQMEGEIKSLGQFQLFDFGDLLSFCNSSFSGRIFRTSDYSINGISEPAIEILRRLRNMAMHGKNPVSKKEDNSIYSMESLLRFHNSLRVLKGAMGKVTFKIRNNTDFITSLELENRSKLEIIQSHHPKALEYFLGIR